MTGGESGDDDGLVQSVFAVRVRDCDGIEARLFRLVSAVVDH